MHTISLAIPPSFSSSEFPQNPSSPNSMPSFLNDITTESSYGWPCLYECEDIIWSMDNLAEVTPPEDTEKRPSIPWKP